MTGQRRWIQNEKLPRPSPSFTGSRSRSSLMAQGSGGELGQNVDSCMDQEEWDDPESEWRDSHGIWRENARDPLPDFE